MRRMHRTDPRRLQAMPDKRSVVMLEPADWDTWLSGSKEDAAALVRLSPVDAYVAGPAQWLED
jgi:putative SOS response-associated peptidase YedK